MRRILTTVVVATLSCVRAEPAVERSAPQTSEQALAQVLAAALLDSGTPSMDDPATCAVPQQGLDATGAEIWRNVKGEPMKDHPDAVLNKVYLDADGGMTLAPYGVKISRDSRLTQVSDERSPSRSRPQSPASS
jgi:hypothetical protein